MMFSIHMLRSIMYNIFKGGGLGPIGVVHNGGYCLEPTMG